jgi:hypothetical protein
MRLQVVLSLVALGLAACVSAEQVAATDCRSYGLTPGTEAYVSCVMQDSPRSQRLLPQAPSLGGWLFSVIPWS